MNSSIKKTKCLTNLKNAIIYGVVLLATSCQVQSKSTGYDNLDKLYSDFVRYLKIGGEDLKEYCFRICPDKGTVAYMEQNNVSYRGIPDELKKQKLEVSIIGEKYYENVIGFRERLIRDRQLDSLVYIGREEQGEELFDKRLNIYATETFILMKSGTDTIRCKLGEMFNYDNKWKSFTSPKLGW
jgi:hypothetical protein